jgi:7-cyano-7-deazaguanine synthase
MMVTRAFVLLSGGLDSTTVLYHALRDFKNVEAVSVNYGQRHEKEIEFARRICDRVQVDHTTLWLDDILGGAMLTSKAKEIPDIHYDEIKGVSPTYVPFRNGLLLSLITAHAQKWINAKPKPEDDGDIPLATEHRNAVVFFGAHAEDAQNWAYPDCAPEFIGAMANAIYIGSYSAIRLHTPLMWLMKHEIVTLGVVLGVPFEDTWSCYAGGAHHCGACPTCYARQDAFKKAGVPDPTIYAKSSELKLVGAGGSGPTGRV